MTNADKYLKDNVSVEELARKLGDHFYNKFINSESMTIIKMENVVKEFLNEQVKPTLTEDEKTILRNIKNDDFGKYIGRGESLLARYKLYLRGDDEYKAFAIGTLYNHLFQFIKERRRI